MMSAEIAETCGYEECLFCYPLVTMTGRVLTEDDLIALVDEAERGYDVSRIRLLREVSAVNCSCSCGTTLRPGCKQGAHCGNESTGCKAYG
jgi:hypothetical protein